MKILLPKYFIHTSKYLRASMLWLQDIRNCNLITHITEATNHFGGGGGAEQFLHNYHYSFCYTFSSSLPALPSESTVLAICRASDVARSVLAGVTARIFDLTFYICRLISDRYLSESRKVDKSDIQHCAGNNHL